MCIWSLLLYWAPHCADLTTHFKHFQPNCVILECWLAVELVVGIRYTDQNSRFSETETIRLVISSHRAALSSVIHNAEYSPTSLNRAAADLTLSTDLREDHNQCNAQLQGSLHVISYDYVLCLLTVNTDLAYCAHRFLIVKALHSVSECGFQVPKTYQAAAHIWGLLR